jgi:hypothetical protein
MNFSRHVRQALVALAAGFLLLAAGCSSDEQISVLTCPQVYLVQDATHYVEYAPGPGTDLIDVRYDAQIVSIEWLCNFLTDQNRVEMEVRFGMRAMMGPSATESQTRFPYFVVVADPEGNIIAKQVFGIDIGFPGNAIEIGHVESVFQKLTYSSIAWAAEYTVYIGFQLTPEQLALARSGRGQ